MGVEQKEDFKTYDTDKNNLLDSKELVLLNKDLMDIASKEIIDSKFNNPSFISGILSLVSKTMKDCKIEDIFYYQNFIFIIKNIKFDISDPQGVLIYKSISDLEKEMNMKIKLNTTLPKDEISGTIDNKINTQIKGEEQFSSSISDLLVNDIHGSDLLVSDFHEKLKNSFEEIKSMNDFLINLNDGLVTGRLNVKDLDHGMISGIGIVQLRNLGKTEQERIKNINKSFPFNLENLEKLNNEQLNNDSLKILIKNFIVSSKPLLDTLADPNSQLSLYIDHIADPLAQQINGTLDYSNLESDQSKKAILNIFHRNPIEFNRLIDDFSGADQIKKDNAEKVITTYYKINTGKDLPAGVKVEFVSNMTIQPEIKDSTGKIITPKVEKPGFRFKNTDGTFVKGDDKGDTVVYFGEEKTGNGQNFEQLLGANGPQWAKDLYKAKDGTVQLDMKTVADIAQQVNFEGGTKVKKPESLKVYGNMSEAIKGFFDNPLFKQLQEALYTLMGLIGTDEQKEKAALDLNRMKSLDTIRARGESIVTRKDPGGKLMIDAIKDNDYAFKEENISYKDKEGKLQQVKINTKAVFVNMTYEEQKFFLENILSGDAQKVQSAKESMITIYNNENPVTITDKQLEATEKKQEKSSEGKEFKNGVSYPELSIDGKLSGKVELKGKDTDKPYLMVDGQAVALTASVDPTLKEGIMFIRDGDKNAFVQTTIKIDKNNNLLVHKGENSISLDYSGNSNLAKIYDKDILKFPILSSNKDIFEYFAFAKSVIPTEPNKVDAIYNAIPDNDILAKEEFEKSITSIQNKILFLKENELNEQNIQKIIIDAKIGDICLSDDNQDPQFKLAVKDWLSIFGIENLNKESI